MTRKILFTLALLISLSIVALAQNKFTAADLLALKSVTLEQLTSNGNQLIYRESTPRSANDKPGGAIGKYMLMDMKTKQATPLFSEEKSAFYPSYSPEGTLLAYLTRVNGVLQVMAQQTDGTEIQLTNSPTNISSFAWSPTGNAIAYIATIGKTERQLDLEKRGYGFIFYEENIINDNLFIQQLDENNHATTLTQVNTNGNVWDFRWDKQGKQLAFTKSENKLIDEKYMFRKLHLYTLSSAKDEMLIDNEGKFGTYSFSPDGSKIAYAAALDKYDSAITQGYIINVTSKEITNFTPENYEGQVEWAAFKSNDEVVYLNAEGVENKLCTYNLKKAKYKTILDSAKEKIIFSSPLFSNDFKTLVFTGSTTTDPKNVYTWDGKASLSRMSDINPELTNKSFGEQEVINYNARDGQAIEGLLIKPVGYQEGKKYPLIMLVHGGPESHHSNAWLSHYSEPGQVFANNGYLVAYINYGSSTGYGIPFSKRGYSSPAAKEFDDLADAIDYICANKGGDKNRVGMAGGSYGGYASAWFSTYYTNYIKASCVFVGITNVISKKGTTDIPYEEIWVHTGHPLEQCWEQSLKASPIYYAAQSKTATLISGGAADTRVSPTQSYELYRRMKVNNHPAVRLVQYPGEGHGNRNQVGRIDFCYRLLAWMDWYVKDLKPLNGEMPPLDISNDYDIDF
ncbi:MAG: prolyl oligopeptidase family serine peptidase [Mangrovibacterium sp.]